MKDKILSILQKVVVLFLVCLMLLCMMPVFPPGILPGSDTPSAEGAYQYILPSAQTVCGGKEKDGTVKISSDTCVYFKFNVSRYADIPIDDIKSIKFNFALLSKSGSRQGRVFVSVSQDSKTQPEKNGSYLFLHAPVIAEFYPDLSTVDDVLCEVDLTEYTKTMLKDGKSEYTVRVATDMEQGADMPLKDCLDPDYRPCLKAVTGMAENEDPETLVRAVLSEKTCLYEQTSEEKQAEQYTIQDGNACSFKFEINEKSVLQMPYRARLALNIADSDGGRLKISCINNGNPLGVKDYETAVSVNDKGIVYADVTQAVCEAVSEKNSMITFKVEAETGTTVVSAGDSSAPHLKIGVTDNKNMVCAELAAIDILPQKKRAEVSFDLPYSYTDSGTSAAIKWEEDTNDSRRNTGHISEKGKIAKPKWFEDDANSTLIAEIKSGNYEINRRYNVIIPKESTPDYSGYTFGNYTDIGNDKSEKAQKFECVGMGNSETRNYGGNSHQYRMLEDGAVIVLNLAVISGEKNYITFKTNVASAQTDDSFEIIQCDRDGKSVSAVLPNDAATAENGFIFSTYEIPEDFVKDKKFVSLKVKYKKTIQSGQRELHAVYMTQNPYFDPEQFAEKDKTMKDSEYTKDTEGKFRKELVGYIRDFDIESVQTIVCEKNPQQAVYYDDKNIVLAGNEINMAFKLNNDELFASIYQRAKYYSVYSDKVSIRKNGDLMVIEYGNYTIMKNTGMTETELAYINETDVYKNVIDGKYYAFSDNVNFNDIAEMAADNFVDGRGKLLMPNEIAVFMKAEEFSTGANWHVVSVNRTNISEFVFDGDKKIESVTVRSEGNIKDGCNRLTLICTVSENGRLLSVNRTETELNNNMRYYLIDVTDFDITLKDGQVMKIFLADNTEKMNEIVPKFQCPQ